MNIFDLIKSVTKRVEPFHSEFLTEALKEESILRKKFLELALPSKFREDLSEQLEISSEYPFDDKSRLDIVIECKVANKIVGIEVKTSDSSVTDNQLDKYYKNLCEKYPEYEVYVVFLTPYNSDNIPTDVLPTRIKAIQEFSEFSKQTSNSSHINWEDVVDMYSNCGLLDNSLFFQHYNFIKKFISNPVKLRNHLSNIERNRSFCLFIGEDTFNEFYDFIKDNGLNFEESDSKFVFLLDDNTSKYSLLIKSLLILVNSSELNNQSSKDNDVSTEVLNAYRQGNYSNFFMQLLNQIEGYKFVWLKGRGNIGVRGLHNSHKSSGVSLFTLLNDRIEVRKER